MLATGELAPDFELPDQVGRKRRLADLQGGKPLILYFYPADFTPGCTREACDLRDLHTQILGAGLRVVGVSPQSPESHRKFRKEHSLPFTPRRRTTTATRDSSKGACWCSRRSC